MAETVENLIDTLDEIGEGCHTVGKAVEGRVGIVAVAEGGNDGSRLRILFGTRIRRFVLVVSLWYILLRLVEDSDDLVDGVEGATEVEELFLF